MTGVLYNKLNNHRRFSRKNVGTEYLTRYLEAIKQHYEHGQIIQNDFYGVILKTKRTHPSRKEGWKSLPVAGSNLYFSALPRASYLCPGDSDLRGFLRPRPACYASHPRPPRQEPAVPCARPGAATAAASPTRLLRLVKMVIGFPFGAFSCPACPGQGVPSS